MKKISDDISPQTTLEGMAAIVCQSLANAGIEVVLTGGAVVSIYSLNEYESYDLDFVKITWSKKVDPIMESLGFQRQAGRHWIHPENPFFVEFPGNTLEIGKDTNTEIVERKYKGVVLKLISPTDCIKDRLAAFYHWNDRQGLDQALMVAEKQKFSLAKVEKWSRDEGHFEKFQQFKQKLKK